MDACEPPGERTHAHSRSHKARLHTERFTFSLSIYACLVSVYGFCLSFSVLFFGSLWEERVCACVLLHAETEIYTHQNVKYVVCAANCVGVSQVVRA